MTYSGRILIIATTAAAIAVGVSAVVVTSLRAKSPAAADRQEQVHDMGHDVMPFDLAKTTHIFEMTDSGGIQDVVAKLQTDTAQIALIRQHLQHEATRFRSGDFADPSALHGPDMPGLQELTHSGGRVRVLYSDLPAGARLTFTTPEQRLITAIHRWFGAQLSDHGADAKYR